MINYICSLLASCFNAHLTEEDKRAVEAAANIRQKVYELNNELKKLPKPAGGWFWINRGYGRDECISLTGFRINKVEVFTHRKVEL